MASPSSSWHQGGERGLGEWACPAAWAALLEAPFNRCDFCILAASVCKQGWEIQFYSWGVLDWRGLALQEGGVSWLGGGSYQLLPPLLISTHLTHVHQIVCSVYVSCRRCVRRRGHVYKEFFLGSVRGELCELELWFSILREAVPPLV